MNKVSKLKVRKVEREIMSIKWKEEKLLDNIN